MKAFDAMPVYVTRKTANGYTGQVSLAVIWVMLILILLATNVILWGGIALYEGVNYIAA